MNIDLFNYELPDSFIAQKPASKREESKLMVLNRNDGTISHHHFYNIIDYLGQNDCLVLNTSKVIPVRLYGHKKDTGAKVEILLIKRLEGDLWEAMVRPGKKVKEGDIIEISQDPFLLGEVIRRGEEGTRHIYFSYEGDFSKILEIIGNMPLPPYIDRAATLEDKDRYQTVYCKEEGSVAAPTAGLHFTEYILEEIARKGVKRANVNLHVGIGTFRPVKCENIEDHIMHFEDYEITCEEANKINQTIDMGGRIIAVGTTSMRTLESAAHYDSGKGGYRVKY